MQPHTAYMSRWRTQRIGQNAARDTDGETPAPAYTARCGIYDAVMALAPSMGLTSCHGSDIGLAPTPAWLTMCHGFDIGLASTLAWLTLCHGSDIGLAPTLAWLTMCYGSDIVMAPTLAWLTLCYGSDIVMAPTLVWLTLYYGSDTVPRRAQTSRWQFLQQSGGHHLDDRNSLYYRWRLWGRRSPQPVRRFRYLT